MRSQAYWNKVKGRRFQFSFIIPYECKYDNIMNQLRSKYDNLTSTNCANFESFILPLLLGKLQCKDTSMVTKTHIFCFKCVLKTCMHSDSLKEYRYIRIYTLETDVCWNETAASAGLIRIHRSDLWFSEY